MKYINFVVLSILFTNILSTPTKDGKQVFLLLWVTLDKGLWKSKYPDKQKITSYLSIYSTINPLVPDVH